MFTAKLLGDAVIAVVMLFMTLSLIHALYREHRRNKQAHGVAGAHKLESDQEFDKARSPWLTTCID